MPGSNKTEDLCPKLDQPEKSKISEILDIADVTTDPYILLHDWEGNTGKIFHSRSTVSARHRGRE